MRFGECRDIRGELPESAPEPCLRFCLAQNLSYPYHGERLAGTAASSTGVLKCLKGQTASAISLVNMANIVIVSCVYPPETNTAGLNCRDLANHLAEGGHKVSVLCPLPSRPIGVKYPSFVNRCKLDVRTEGRVSVIRLPSFAAPQSKLWPRFRESYSFGMAASRYLAQLLPDTQAVYAMAWPLVGQHFVSQTAVKLGIPLIINVQDIYPESLLQKLPRWMGKCVYAPLLACDRAIVNRAQGLVVISENMRKTYWSSRRVPPSRVVTIPTWHDDQRFWPLPDRTVAAQRYQVPEELFTFLYLGNIGPVAGVEDLIRAFSIAAVPSTQLIIIGDGSRKAACQGIVAKSGVSNIRFLSDPDVANVPLLQSLADICVLPVRPGDSLSSIPSKLISYLFSAKPVFAIVDPGSDSERIILASKCGWVVNSGDVTAAVQQIKQIAAEDREELTRRGRNGRAYGLEHFAKARCVSSLAHALCRFAGLNPSTPAAQETGKDINNNCSPLPDQACL